VWFVSLFVFCHFYFGLTPRYGWNIANVGHKHQSINYISACSSSNYSFWLPFRHLQPCLNMQLHLTERIILTASYLDIHLVSTLRQIWQHHFDKHTIIHMLWSIVPSMRYCSIYLSIDICSFDILSINPSKC
jgi:hypothetical protein